MVKRYTPVEIAQALEDYLWDNRIKTKDFLAKWIITSPTYYSIKNWKSRFVQDKTIKKLIEWGVLDW